MINISNNKHQQTDYNQFDIKIDNRFTKIKDEKNWRQTVQTFIVLITVFTLKKTNGKSSEFCKVIYYWNHGLLQLSD